jgi:genome maintenance exonuclease 1
MATSESLQQTETINGKRYYVIGKNKYPSVTTVLGSMTDSSGLDDWRKRVGEEEADRISKFSANRGTIMHQMIEFYLGSTLEGNRQRLREAQEKIIEFAKEEGFSEEELEVGRRLFYSFYNNGLFNRISKVISIEETLYSHQMGGYAGRVDNIYENTFAHLLILDFKTSRKQKKKDWIKNYFMQIAAYFLAYWEMHGVKPKGGEIWIAVENDEPQIFEVTWEDIKVYGKEFLSLVKKYHELNPLQPEYIKK